MSGHKSAVVTISQEEYRRLYEAERNLYYENVEQVSKNRQVELENQVRELADHIEDRETHYINLLKGLDDGLRGIEVNSTQEMLKEQLNYLNDYLDHQNHHLATLNDDIEVRERMFDEKVNSLQSQIENSFTDLQNSLAERLGKDRDYKVMSEVNVEAINQLLQIIIHSFPAHIFNFNDFDQKNDELTLVISNLDKGANQAALGLSQSLYLFLSNHKRKCDQKYLDWQLLKNQVETALRLLEGNFAMNQKIQPIDKSGQLIGAEIDTNYWSQGIFSELEQKVKDMISYLVGNGQEVSYADLKSILSDFINPIQDLYIQCLMDARINALNAQIRYEIANSVLVALVEQGFRPVTGDYRDGSYFGSYQASALNSSGNQVDIFIEPGPTNLLENSLHIISQNHQLSTTDELQSRAREIRNSLINQGLQVGVFSETQSSTDHPMGQSYQTQNQLSRE